MMNSKIVLGIALLAGGLVYMVTKKDKETTPAAVVPSVTGSVKASTPGSAATNPVAPQFKVGDKVSYSGKTATIQVINTDGTAKIRIGGLVPQILTVKLTTLIPIK